jgi:hypothetical protein
MMTPRLAAIFVSLLACNAGLAEASPEAMTAPRLTERFWTHWGDGQAELCGYELSFRRYGVARRGTCVSIFVTETFSNEARVKADPGRHAESDRFPVMKLNLIQDFPTGVYDYNMQLSCFTALSPINGRPAGATTKLSFSSQEWCGHVYQQLLFDAGSIRSTSHSYFDGEGDQAKKLEYPAEGISEDALFSWARGFCSPALAPGESRTVKLLTSLETARLKHVDLSWRPATLSYPEGQREIEVPAGRFTVERREVETKDGERWRFEVEAAWPHRLIAWSSSRGHQARLTGSKRMKYWQQNGPGGARLLEGLGLKARPPRTN